MNLLFIPLMQSILLVLFSSPEVLAINCYQCESNSDIECSEKFDEENTKLRPEPCDHVFESRFCIKSTGMFEGQIGTKRFCSSRDYGDYCDYVRRPGDERDYRSCVFTCSSDACNQSFRLYSSKFSSFFLIISSFLYSCHYF